MSAARSTHRRLIWPDRVWADMVRRKRQAEATGNARPYGVHPRPGILEFLATLQADLIRSFPDGEHSAALAVTAPEGKLKDPKQRCHKSSARCRRSQLPWASSQSSRERTLA